MVLTNTALEKRIQDWVKAYDLNGYLHGSILVAAGQKIIMNEGYGMANWQHQIPNSPKTKFRIGSITKGFTAMAIFQLAEKNRLKLDDPIDKYLPWYPNDCKITIYHCLTNTSGIADFTGFPDFWFKTMRLPATLLDIINSFKYLELEFEPGSQYRYSTSGFMLLTAIIEEITQQKYQNYMKENIFLPLGMHDTGCDDGRKIIQGLASGHSFWEEPIHAEFADLSFPLGGYGMYSTTEDLYKWSQCLRESTLISKELTEMMLKPHQNSYACGWAVSSFLGRKYISHFGDISGFTNDFLFFPDDNVTIICLSNMNITPVMKFTRELAKTVFDETVSLPYPAIPIPFNSIQKICGTFSIENETGSQSIEISSKEKDLYLTVPKMYGAVYKFKLIPIKEDDSQTNFITEMINESLEVHYEGEKVTNIEYTDYYGGKQVLHKK